MTAQSAKQVVSMDAKFVNAFLHGTMNTFKIQCSYELKPMKPYLLQGNEDIPSDLCGVIGLTSNVFRGAITLCFSKPMFLSVMGSMFGETFTEVTNELSDGAGELLNIIFGQAKTILTDQGLVIEKAIPTVVSGNKIKVFSLTGGGPTIVVPFEAKDGKIHVLISLGYANQEESKVVKKP